MSAVAEYQSALRALDAIRVRVADTGAKLSIAGGQLTNNPVALMTADGRIDPHKFNFSTVGTDDLAALLSEYFSAIGACQKAHNAIDESERGAVVAPPKK